MSPLSKKCAAALEVLREHGELQRGMGGRWTYPGCPSITDTLTKTNIYSNHGIPIWFVRRGTVAALVARGHAVVTSLYYSRPKSVAFVETTSEAAS